MIRGPKVKPAHLKLLEGNPGKRRVPTNEVRPRCDRIPEPPPFLIGIARQEWDRVAPQLYHLGLLTGVDIMPLAAYCQACGRWILAETRQAEMAERDELTSGLVIKTTNGSVIQSPLVGIARRAAADMVRYASEFGLTPSARARLALDPPPPKKSKFDGLIG
jgi:P27 family predicted phage terminase small subunit